jgi:hypothetical protein
VNTDDADLKGDAADEQKKGTPRFSFAESQFRSAASALTFAGARS